MSPVNRPEEHAIGVPPWLTGNRGTVKLQFPGIQVETLASHNKATDLAVTVTGKLNDKRHFPGKHFSLDIIR
jgi:hypothetical protein